MGGGGRSRTDALGRPLARNRLGQPENLLGAPLKPRPVLTRDLCHPDSPGQFVEIRRELLDGSSQQLNLPVEVAWGRFRHAADYTLSGWKWDYTAAAPPRKRR